MTSIIIFAPVLFYRLLIFRSFFALGGQLIILHGNDNGIAFFYLICQNHLGCQGLHVLLDITLQRPVSYTHLDVYKRQKQRTASPAASVIQFLTLPAQTVYCRKGAFYGVEERCV